MELHIYWLWAVAAALLASLTIGVVLRINIRDIPNERSSHKTPTPKAGGLAVFVPFWLTLLGCLLMGKEGGAFWGLLGGSLGMFLMGLWDDVQGLSWKTRLGVQVLMATLVVTLGLYVPGVWFPYFGYVSFGSSAPLLSILAIVVFTNLYNFMDGLNGLSIGCTLIGLGFLGFMWEECPKEVAYSGVLFLLLISLWASLLVLFFFNFPKGKIFLGDTGSQFIGFTVVVMGIMLSLADPSVSTDIPFLRANATSCPTLSPFVVPFLFFTFLFDGVVTLVRRLWLRVPMWEADRGHVFHRLLENSTPARVAYTHFALFVSSGIIVMIFLRMEHRFFVLAVLPLLVLHGVYLTFICYRNKKGPA